MKPLLGQLTDALEQVRRGFGDFGIGPTRSKGTYGTKDKASEDLVFWLCFGHRRVD